MAHWREGDPALQHLLIVWTDGELVWDEAAGDFDWSRTTALPPELAGVFATEPLWVDLRWARAAAQLSLKDPQFLQAVGDLAAPLHDRPKEDLLGEDVRQQRRALRLAGAAITALVVLLVAAAVAAVIAVGQRDVAERNADLAATETARAEAETFRAENEAERADAEARAAESAEQTAEARRGEAEEARNEALAQARIALSRQLTAQATSERTGALDLRLLLAMEAIRLDPQGVDARGSLLTLLSANPALDRFLHGAEGSEVGALAFSPSSALLAATRRDGSTVLWDVAAGKPIGEPLRAGPGVAPFPTVVFSADGRTLATGGSGGVIVRWDVATRQPAGKPLVVPTLDAETQVYDLAFAPDGRFIYSAGSDLLAWDLTAGTPRAERIGDGGAGMVAVSPDGRLLATDGPLDAASILLWDAATRERIGGPLILDAESLATPETVAYGPVISGVAFSPDGRFLAASDNAGRIVVWDAQTLPRLRDLPPAAAGYGISDIVFSADSAALISTGYDGEVVVWNLDADPMTGAIIGQIDTARAVASSPDGRWLATGGQDGRVVLWDPARWSALGQTLVSDDNFRGEIAFSPDGQLLTAGSTAGNVVLWDAATGQPAGELLGDESQYINAVAFSPDGRLLASGNDHGDIALWDIVTRQPIATREGAHAREISVVAFSPDSQLLASGAADGVVGIWDVSTDQLTGEALVGMGDVLALSFSPDGQLLAAGFVGGADAAVLWDVARRSIVARLPGSGVSDVIFSPDGRQLIVAQNDVTFRDTTTFQPIGMPIVPAAGSVASLAVSPDGRILVTGNSDGTIQLWDVPSRQPIGQPIRSHEEWIGALAFAPGGSLLASRGMGHYTAPLLWQVDVASWQATACQWAGRNLSQEEWAQFLGSEDYRQTCPDFPEPSERRTPTPRTAPDGPLDLAALITPGWFGQDGGVVDSYTRTLNDKARAIADARGQDVATVRALLQSAGWRRQQGIAFETADVATLGSGQVGIEFHHELIVTEYETAEGATTAFAYLETESSGGGTPVPLAILFEEQAIATHESGTDSSGIPYEDERLVFRFDNLVAEVEIRGYGHGMEIMPGLAEGYGAELHERMAQVRTQGGPGLGNRILRLAGDEISEATDRDRYLRLGGQDLLTFSEAVEGLAPPGGPADDVRQPYDTYRVYTAIGDTPSAEYTVYLFAYPSSEIAAGIFAALREDLNDWATPVAQDPPPTFERAQISNTVFGEESVTVSQRRWVGEPSGVDSYLLYGYVTWARVGAEIVVMFLEAPQPPPLELANELMTKQVACLRAVDLCEPIPVPEELRVIDPATPAPSPGPQ